MFSVYKLGWCWRLGGIPQETPVNQEKKNGFLQNACPRFIAKPQCQSFYQFVSYKMVGLELPPT